MKIRTDFVTNSSSSCFVVAYKNKKIDALTEAQNPTLKLLNDAIRWFVESDAHYETEEGYEATNETELVEAIGQKYDYHIKGLREGLEHGDYDCFYEEAKEAIKNGFTVVYKEISHHDHSTRDIMDTLYINFPDNFMILGEECH